MSKCGLYPDNGAFNMMNTLAGSLIERMSNVKGQLCSYILLVLERLGFWYAQCHSMKPTVCALHSQALASNIIVLDTNITQLNAVETSLGISTLPFLCRYANIYMHLHVLSM